MAEADLSKIVSLIMENPKLIEEIKSLAEEKTASEPAAAETAAEPAKEPEAVETFAPQKIRRRDLLCALKPYVSEERSRAIDSMLSISDILDMMKAR